MSVKLTDKEKDKLSLMNVSYYDSKAKYMATVFSDITEETGEEEFNYCEERGYIEEITCGTYNVVTNSFNNWELTDENILKTILNNSQEDGFYYFITQSKEDENVSNDWSNSDWIYEYTTVYDVFIIGNRVYANKD